jgi:hypothetical protein
MRSSVVTAADVWRLAPSPIVAASLTERVHAGPPAGTVRVTVSGAYSQSPG